MGATEVSLKEFAESLPEGYRERFDTAQIAAHAHAAAGRRLAGREVGARLFPWHQPSTTALCVVAEDRPGLLSKITRALAELGYDVDSALAYTRRPVMSKPAEAVDLFFLRDPGRHLRDQDVEGLVELITQFLKDELDPIPSSLLEPPGAGTHTTVRFIEDAQGALDVLEVETSDRSGLLFALTRALYQENVQIVGSKISTVGGRVHDRFLITELDGSPIGPERRLVIQVAVLTALGN